jgi:hypothetical protein
MICRYLQKLGRIVQAVDLIQNDSTPSTIFQKSLMIRHESPDSGELAVEVLHIGKALAKASLTNPTHPG